MQNESTVVADLEVTLDTDVNIAVEAQAFYERVYKQGTELELLNTSYRIPTDPTRDMDGFVLYAFDTLTTLSQLEQSGEVVPDILAVRFTQIQKLRHAMTEDLFLDYERKLSALNDGI